jgi:hypothetical protein
MNDIIDPTKYTAHQHPGKFECQHPATEYFWEQLMNGDGETIFGSVEYEDEQAQTAHIFHINAEESEAFDLPISHWYMIAEDSQGFVVGSVHETREQAEQSFRKWLGL